MNAPFFSSGLGGPYRPQKCPSSHWKNSVGGKWVFRCRSRSNERRKPLSQRGKRQMKLGLGSSAGSTLRDWSKESLFYDPRMSEMATGIETEKNEIIFLKVTV